MEIGFIGLTHNVQTVSGFKWKGPSQGKTRNVFNKIQYLNDFFKFSLVIFGLYRKLFSEQAILIDDSRQNVQGQWDAHASFSLNKCYYGELSIVLL